MWVRSQNREVLINVNNLYINQRGNEYSIIVDYCNDNWFALGTYKSKERAIEVLDDIQHYLDENWSETFEMPEE